MGVAHLYVFKFILRILVVICLKQINWPSSKESEKGKNPISNKL